MKPQLTTLLSVLLCLTIGLSASAEFPTVTNNEKDTAAKPMPPAQAAAGFQLPDGFEVSVFASEPDVQNPIDMAWDAKGRLWIAENYTYSSRAEHFDLSLHDRLIVLEDTDSDGKADKRTVVTDQLQMLTSVEVGHGGVWLMCPPRVLFIPDRNHDLVPDGPIETVIDGFTVANQNYHNFANGLRFGPDGWLYGRCGGSCPGRIGLPGAPANERLSLEGGIWRYHPQKKSLEVWTHGTCNPWGHDWDENYELFFINTVNGHLWHGIPGSHLKRPFELDPNTRTYELLDMHADHWHFDTGKGWGKSKYGAANEYGGGHAHTGMMIYQGDNWPEKYRGSLLTFNIHGQRLNQELLQPHGSGYVGKHGKDMLIASDPFFRGMELSYGPHGSVFVTDWSDTGECHEHTGVHRTSGRVYEVTHGNSKREPCDDLYAADANELARMHTLDNEWLTRQARIVLTERAQNGSDVTAAKQGLSKLAQGTDRIAALRATLTLYAMGELPRDLLVSRLNHTDPHQRVWAIRMLTNDWPLDDTMGPTFFSRNNSKRVLGECYDLVERFCHLAENDDSGLVRLTLASTIQRLPLSQRAKLAKSLMTRVEDAEDHNLPLMVWYGLMPLFDDHHRELASLVAESKWPKTQRFICRALAESLEKRATPIETILASAVQSKDSDVQRNILLGVEDGLRGWPKANQPSNWNDVVASAKGTTDKELGRVIRALSVVFGDGKAVDEIRKIVLDKEADANMRRSALESLVTSGTDGLKEVCFAVLGNQRLNVTAAKGLALFDDPDVAQKLIENYKRFRGPRKPAVVSVLVSRPKFVHQLLDAIEQKKIPADALTAYDVRQIHSHGDKKLIARCDVLWGAIRESSTDKVKRMDELKTTLTKERLAKANKSHGRALFNKTCSKCHRMYGIGESIGPDLTGSNRDNIDYLLSNILDPSAIVSKDYRMSIVETERGQVLNGLITTQNDKTITLQTQTELRTLAKQDIESIRATTFSPMPDGLLNNLSGSDIDDLFAYLMHPNQVDAETAKP